LRIADQLRIVDCGIRSSPEISNQSEIRNPRSEINPQSAIRNPQ
jgi:hypothetical protein